MSATATYGPLSHLLRFEPLAERTDLQGRLRRMYRVNLKQGEDGWIVARCEELPAAITQGKTKEEAIKRIFEAISLVIEESEGISSQGSLPEFVVIPIER